MKQNSRGAVLLIPLILLASVAVIIISFFIIQNSRQKNTSPTITKSTTSPVTPKASELPELYPSLQWKTIERKKLLFISRNGENVEEEGFNNEAEAASGSQVADFFNYYQQELLTKGWEATGGTGGPDGGRSDFYEKNGHYFIIGVWKGGPPYLVYAQHN